MRKGKKATFKRVLVILMACLILPGSMPVPTAAEPSGSEAAKTCTVTVNMTGSGSGTVRTSAGTTVIGKGNSSGTTKVTAGDALTIQVTPDTGSRILSVAAGENSLTATGAGVYTISHVTADQSITVTMGQTPALKVTNSTTDGTDPAFAGYVGESSVQLQLSNCGTGDVCQVYETTKYETGTALQTALAAGSATDTQELTASAAEQQSSSGMRQYSYTAEQEETCYFYAIVNQSVYASGKVIVDLKQPEITNQSTQYTHYQDPAKDTCHYTASVTDTNLAQVQVTTDATTQTLQVQDGKVQVDAAAEDSCILTATDRAGHSRSYDLKENRVVYSLSVVPDTSTWIDGKWSADAGYPVQAGVTDASGAVEVGMSKTVDFSQDHYQDTPAAFFYDKNGSYYFYAKDAAGNITCQEELCTNIDQDAPQLTLQKQTSDHGWAAEDRITGTVTDAVSGVKDVFYTLPSDREQKHMVMVDADGTFSIPCTEEDTGEIQVTAEDNVAAFSSQDHRETKTIQIQVDSVAPQNLELQFDENFTRDQEQKPIGFVRKFNQDGCCNYIYRKESAFTVHAEESRTMNGVMLDSGIASYEYKLVPEGADTAAYDWITAADGAGQTDCTISYKELEADQQISFKNGFRGKVYVRVTDCAGNRTAVLAESRDNGNGNSYMVVEQSNSYAPAVLAAGNAEGTAGWHNSYTYTMSYEADRMPVSGVNRYEYQTLENGVCSSWAPITGNEFSLQNQFNGTVRIRSVSNAENESESADAGTFRIWTKQPENATVEVNGTQGQNKDWYRAVSRIAITAPTPEKDGPGITVYYKIWNTTNGETEETATVKQLDQDREPVVREDGIYELKVWTVDEAGNRCANDLQQTIRLDGSAPQIRDITVNAEGGFLAPEEEVTFTHFYQTAVQVRISADCMISGEGEVTYQKVAGMADYQENGQWLAYDADNGVLVTPNDKCVIYFCVKDQAGNQTICHSQGILADDQAPVGENLAPDITIRPASADSNGYYHADTTAEITATDPRYSGVSLDPENGSCSGLASVTYRIYAEDTEAEETGVLYSSQDGGALQETWQGTLAINSAVFNSNRVVIEVTATDRVGNSKTTRTNSGDIRIDTTAPQMTVSYDNNAAAADRYFKDDRTATLSVTERNFDPDLVNVMIESSNGTAPSVEGWTQNGGNGNGDDTVWTAVVHYQEDGDYTFAVTCADAAGNICQAETYAEGTAAAQAFTIDRTKPQIQVSYDNNQVSEGDYFNQARTATISVQEHNFDAGQVVVTASKDGNVFTPAVNGWSNDGDRHDAAVTFDDDGVYTLAVTAVDMAGNESDAAEYQGAAAQNFTVDRTIAEPVITINQESGDGKAYAGDMILGIQFADTNYEGYTCSLTRTRRNEKEEDVTEQFLQGMQISADGGIGTYDTFAKTPENDGIYTLTVSVLDKAGNQVEKQIRFTLNRYGSVYVYSEYLDSLIQNDGAYVQNVSQDLEITEYNPSQLVSGSLHIAVTKDGKPVSNVAYTAAPEANPEVVVGESGWYQYQYVISRNNFNEDGVYKVTVSSGDTAGNTPENTGSREQEIQFYVDSEAPELTSVTGLEQKIVNAGSLDVNYDTYDTVGLSSVEVYVDGQKTDAAENLAKGRNEYTGAVQLQENKKVQHVRIVVTDRAGNVTDTDSGRFTSAYRFNPDVTVSTNFFVRLYANSALFWSAMIVAAAALTGAVILLAVRKRKKEA